MASYPIDWYQHLVDQSKTDHIYDLIHEYIPGGWEPNHNLDLVVVRTSGLPVLFSEDITVADRSLALAKESYSFPESDYVLLHNYRLTAYLEAAKRIQIIEDTERRQFLELLFTKAPVQNETDDNDADDEKYTMPDYLNSRPENLEDKEDALLIAYDLLAKAGDRELAYSYAKIGEEFLNAKRKGIVETPELDYEELERAMIGYNIVGTVYLWNDKLEEAKRVDGLYLQSPLVWDKLVTHIGHYLEILIAKNQGVYLGYLFEYQKFRDRFVAHYETYISLLVDGQYELTKMREVVTIMNRVRNSYSAYL